MTPSRGDVWLIGGGGHAKVVAATLRAAGWDVRGAFDDDEVKRGDTVLDVPILGAPPEAAAWWRGRTAFLALGCNDARRRLAGSLSPGAWAVAVHPSAVVHSSARVGPGTIVGAGAIVQPDAVIGAHVIVNTAAVVEHDSRVGDFCHVAPNATLCGGVRVGDGALVGTGAVAVPGVRIGAGGIVGAGAVVLHDVPPRATCVGVPGRPTGRAAADEFRGGAA